MKFSLTVDKYTPTSGFTLDYQNDFYIINLIGSNLHLKGLGEIKRAKRKSFFKFESVLSKLDIKYRFKQFYRYEGLLFEPYSTSL